MKKFPLIFFCIWISSSFQNQVHAQFIEGQYLIGTGFSMSFMPSNILESKARPGMNCTFGYKYDFSDKFGMLAYFNFTNMGANATVYKEEDSGPMSPVPFKLYYSNIGIDYLGSFKVKDPISIQFGGCVYLKWMFSKKLEMENLYLTESDDYINNEYLPSLMGGMLENYGLVAGISAGTENIMFSMNYTYLLRDMCTGQYNDFRIRNTVLELKVMLIIDKQVYEY